MERQRELFRFYRGDHDVVVHARDHWYLVSTVEVGGDKLTRVGGPGVGFSDLSEALRVAKYSAWGE